MIKNKTHPYDPWFKTTLTLDRVESSLSFRVPHDVFSTQRIDEGTLLLLEHLSAKTPKTILDMGCGYGALGLPIAARYPDAKVEMVDRDLMAVKWSLENAKNNDRSNVQVYGSLGFRDVQGKTYDWILCNVPARIGRPFIKNLIQSGRARLNEGGDLRLVVINDLCPMLIELEKEMSGTMLEVKRGPRHTVYSFSPDLNHESTRTFEVDPAQLYFRDEITFLDLSVVRPFDLGGDDPKRLKSGLPVLIDALPRDPKKKLEQILCFRSGYGIIPLLCKKRWPQSKVVSIERDLLASCYTRINAQKLGLTNGFEVREKAHFPDALAPDEAFQLIVGELSPSAGDRVVIAEIQAVVNALAKGGEAYLLCLQKLDKESVQPFAVKNRISITATIQRDGYAALRIFKA